MSKVRVRWAFCAADVTKNGHVDHVDSEVAETLQREGRLTIEPLVEEPTATAVAVEPAKPKK